MASDCDLILPCRDEGPALSTLLPRVPEQFTVTVVDNGSTDSTVAVARENRATVVPEQRLGYGAAVHAGLLSATREYVAFMDGDGSFDPDALVGLLDDVRAGRADPAVGGTIRTAHDFWKMLP
jgi:glycosyltransferase involved in cell wall biosynthesis